MRSTRGAIAYRLAWLARVATTKRRITLRDRQVFCDELRICERTLIRDLHALEQGGWALPPWQFPNQEQAS